MEEPSSKLEVGFDFMGEKGAQEVKGDRMRRFQRMAGAGTQVTPSVASESCG